MCRHRLIQVSAKGRGLPDLAGDAAPLTGYRVTVDGSSAVIGRTSAVAPLVAGLIALLSQALSSPVGYLNPDLYKKLAISPGAFRDITPGITAHTRRERDGTHAPAGEARWEKPF